jgi:heme/copper-type cytochrome/quinol oxidase subunit 4
MIGNDPIGPRNAWLLLLLISVVSFGAAELMGERHVAIAAIMAIAAVKIVVVLVRFMEIDRAPTAIRRYLYGWNIGCAGLIFVLWWTSAP